MKEWISGRNPVYEALRANRRHFFRLQIAQNVTVPSKGQMAEIIQLASSLKLTVERVHRLPANAEAGNPQGVALETSVYPYSTLQDILDLAAQKQEDAFVLILDELQDPQNLGTLLRAAEAMGVHGVLLPLARSAGVTPSVVHSSSGASEHLLIAPINLAQGIETLKEAGVWVMGLEGSAGSPIGEARLDGALALVVGSEGEGMRPLTRRSCDLLVRLPMQGKINSLNAATAGAIALYLAAQARQSRAGKLAKTKVE